MSFNTTNNFNINYRYTTSNTNDVAVTNDIANFSIADLTYNTTNNVSLLIGTDTYLTSVEYAPHTIFNISDVYTSTNTFDLTTNAPLTTSTSSIFTEYNPSYGFVLGNVYTANNAFNLTYNTYSTKSKVTYEVFNDLRVTSANYSLDFNLLIPLTPITVLNDGIGFNSSDVVQIYTNDTLSGVINKGHIHINNFGKCVIKAASGGSCTITFPSTQPTVNDMMILSSGNLQWKARPVVSNIFFISGIVTVTGTTETLIYSVYAPAGTYSNLHATIGTVSGTDGAVLVVKSGFDVLTSVRQDGAVALVSGSGFTLPVNTKLDFYLYSTAGGTTAKLTGGRLK
jgi:hypothetical protein